MLIHIICTKLDQNTLRAWDTKTSKTEDSELVEFLQERFQVLEVIEGTQKLNQITSHKFLHLN